MCCLVCEAAIGISLTRSRTHSHTHTRSFWRLVIRSSEVITSASHTFATEVSMPTCCRKSQRHLSHPPPSQTDTLKHRCTRTHTDFGALVQDNMSISKANTHELHLSLKQKVCIRKVCISPPCSPPTPSFPFFSFACLLHPLLLHLHDESSDPKGEMLCSVDYFHVVLLHERLS